ncbi:MAG: protein phosphatase 2C domain-containing protein [Undibacterium umbellatum]|uniref:PP2C family serine/threonine-protein phosphatase n=1 Tax=Undibacterium umbellatum TaxID=2762300 RepID=UPI003BB77CA7
MSSKSTAIELYAHILLEQNGNSKSDIDHYIGDPRFGNFVKKLEGYMLRDFNAFLKSRSTSANPPATESRFFPPRNLPAPPVVTKHEFSELPPLASASHKSTPPQEAKPASQSLARNTESDAMKIPSQVVPGPATDAAASLPPATTKTPAAISDHKNIRFVVSNARCQEAYTSKVIPDQAQTENYQILDIIIPEQLGLRYNDVLEELSGIPAVQGDFPIQITYRFTNEQANRLATLNITVTPNPKSMWLNKPSDKSAIYWKPDEDAKFVQGKNLNLVAASKRGRSHAHVGSFRDDDFSIEYLTESDWGIAIVSDGAGSCSYSRRGSQIICDTAMQHIKGTLNAGKSDAIGLAAENYSRARSANTDAVQTEKLRLELRNELYLTVSHAAYHCVVKILEEVSLVADAKLKDFSSTALISVCKKFSFGTLCAAYWVGDGAVGVYSSSKGISLLGEVDSGEFSGQTRFLDKDEVTAEALSKRLRFDVFDDVTAFILMSDGVSDPKFETEARLARSKDWDALWQDMNAAVAIVHDDETDAKAQKLLDWLDFWSQGNHDDRTIAIVY